MELLKNIRYTHTDRQKHTLIVHYLTYFVPLEEGHCESPGFSTTGKGNGFISNCVMEYQWLVRMTSKSVFLPVCVC